MQSWGKTKVQCLVRNTHSGIYYARARVNGKLVWKTLETDSITVAKVRLPKVLTEIGRGSARPIGNLTHSEILTFADAARAHLVNVEARVDLKPATKHYWQQVVTALQASWPELFPRKLTKVTKGDAQAWAIAYQSKVSPTRFNNSVDCLKSIFALAIKEGAIFQNPAAELGKVKVRAKKLQLPSKEEFMALLSVVRGAGAWCSKPCGDLIEFLAFSGCRINEAKNVRWIDVEEDFIWVRGDAIQGTKGGEMRKIPIIDPMRALLDDLKANPRAFRGEREGFVLAVNECQKAIDSACAEIKIGRFTHHDLRHLFATRCIESGVDIPTMSRWLGHADGGALAMKTYGHLQNEHSLAMAKKVLF